MEAKVQILPVDRPTLNGNYYPRSVVEKALKSMGTLPVGVIPVKAFLSNDGCPKVSDLLGVAKNLRLDEDTNMVIADVRIDRNPPHPYTMASAGFGTVQNGTVVDFTFTGVVVSDE
jgi:hypothetical protein